MIRCNFLQSLKKFCEGASEQPKVFENLRWSPNSFLSYKRLKLKLRVFLAGHTVAMVTYSATQLIATCSPILGQFVDTMILSSTGIEWL